MDNKASGGLCIRRDELRRAVTTDSISNFEGRGTLPVAFSRLRFSEGDDMRCNL